MSSETPGALDSVHHFAPWISIGENYRTMVGQHSTWQTLGFFTDVARIANLDPSVISMLSLVVSLYQIHQMTASHCRWQMLFENSSSANWNNRTTCRIICRTIQCSLHLYAKIFNGVTFHFQMHWFRHVVWLFAEILLALQEPVILYNGNVLQWGNNKSQNKTFKVNETLNDK